MTRLRKLARKWWCFLAHFRHRQLDFVGFVDFGVYADCFRCRKCGRTWEIETRYPGDPAPG